MGVSLGWRIRNEERLEQLFKGRLDVCAVELRLLELRREELGLEVLGEVEALGGRLLVVDGGRGPLSMDIVRGLLPFSVSCDFDAWVHPSRVLAGFDTDSSAPTPFTSTPLAVRSISLRGSSRPARRQRLSCEISGI